MTSRLFLQLCASWRLPEPVAEYKFCPTRRWKMDYAWPTYGIALEVEGGAYTQGRHTRGSGFVADMEKYNEAACLGFRVVRVTPKQLFTAETEQILRRLLVTPDPTAPHYGKGPTIY